MSSVTTVKLPYNNVTLDVLARVIGVAAGLPVIGMEPARIDGVRIEPTERLDMVSIVLRGNMVGGRSHERVTVHLLARDEGRTIVLLQAESSAFWLAVLRRVVYFFGGEIQFNDEAAGGAWQSDYGASKPTTGYNPLADDGAEWYELQNTILQVSPVTLSELHQYNEFARYKYEYKEKPDLKALVAELVAANADEWAHRDSDMDFCDEDTKSRNAAEMRLQTAIEAIQKEVLG